MRNQESTAVFEEFQRQYNTFYSIGDLTPTLCALWGIREPAACGGKTIAPVLDQADKLMDGLGKVEKTVLFCADALGNAQKEYYTEAFEKIRKVAGFEIKSTAVMPSVTPVCFGTIFSGAAPCVHGIMKYEKPVLSVETLFDVFAESGKNVAIIAVNECSIDKIFRQRKVDYYSVRTDEQSFQLARRFIADDTYDLILCYMIGYDAEMHKTGPFSETAAAQAKLAAERFSQFSEDMETYWKKYNRVLSFVVDHGGHSVDEQHGGHGENIPEDMIVNHYYRICEKSC